jgi:DNA gyrase/topoisomerase IV subunit A
VARSIPSVIDGFKPSQRKVIFCAFKRPITSDIKVAQMIGYVSEHSAYHHGEQSLEACIVNMAQDCGFILHGKIDMVKCAYENQYLYIFIKPS